MDYQIKIRTLVEELYINQNFDILEASFSEDYKAYAELKTYKGLKFIRQHLKRFHHSIKDIKVVKIDFLCEEVDKVTWQRTLKGKHVNNMQGIPASNKIIQWQEMVVSRFEDGKICEEWLVSDLAGQLLIALKF